MRRFLLAPALLLLLSATLPGSALAQAGCTFALSPAGASFPAIGGSGAFQLTASATTCSWNAEPKDSWVQITSATSGHGSTTITYTVSPSNKDE
ncbi:MAG: BACON domain-containing protein, partial [Acidobacteria bacterium]|nr:BACON domain-containing protein [Acidobacteriota bacterium]